MNQGILGNARATGGSPARPFATPAQARDGTDASLVISPAALASTRRGTGRAWFWELFADFAMAASGQEAGTDGCAWFGQLSGAGAFCNSSTSPLRAQDLAAKELAGVLSIGTGTTSTGRGGFDSGINVSTHRYDTGVTFMEALIYIQSLASAAEDYVFRWGYMNGTGFVNDQIGFEYNRSNSPNWVGVCTFNGNSTRFDTGIPVESGKWIRLRARFDANTIWFQVNDTLPFGGSTSNIRTDGGGRFGAHIIKTAGTTSVGVAFDYVYYRHDFTRERTYT